MCPRQTCLSSHETVARSMYVLCALGWADGSDFLNNGSRLPPEGRAKEEHLYGIKAMERMKEREDFGKHNNADLLINTASRVSVYQN